MKNAFLKISKKNFLPDNLSSDSSFEGNFFLKKKIRIDREEFNTIENF